MSVQRAWRVPVSDPLATALPRDYADAFELRLTEGDRSRPEAWLRAGIEGTPGWIKRIAGRDGFAGATIVRSDPNLVMIEGSDPLMHTTLIGRNIEHGRMLTTVLRYRRPRLARFMWLFVAPLHRRTACSVIQGGRCRNGVNAI